MEYAAYGVHDVPILRGTYCERSTCMINHRAGRSKSLRWPLACVRFEAEIGIFLPVHLRIWEDELIRGAAWAIPALSTVTVTQSPRVLCSHRRTGPFVHFQPTICLSSAIQVLKGCANRACRGFLPATNSYVLRFSCISSGPGCLQEQQRQRTPSRGRGVSLQCALLHFVKPTATCHICLTGLGIGEVKISGL